MSTKRIKNVSLRRPIMYGNTAVPLTEKEKAKNPSPDHSHRWTVFVRDPSNIKDNEGLSYFIKKVVFKLHDTYQNPSRSIEEPPFEVVETGWGEFEVGIKIYFQSTGEKPIQLYHRLKLHPYPNADQTEVKENQENGETEEKKEKTTPVPVESIIYDELIFNEPTEQIFEYLTSKPGNLLPATKSEDVKFSREAERDELDRLSAAIDKVEQEIKKEKERLVESS